MKWMLETIALPLSIIAGALILACAFRFEFAQTRDERGLPNTYLFDRWTGRLSNLIPSN